MGMWNDSWFGGGVERFCCGRCTGSAIMNWAEPQFYGGSDDVNIFQSNLGLAHWKAIKRTLRYLKRTVNYIRCYHGSDLCMIEYSDVDWGSDLDEHKFKSGYVFFLNNGAITLSGKKQPCIALLTMEPEYVACSIAVQEAVWLRRLFQNLEVVKDVSDSVAIHYDSITVFAYAKDSQVS
ncbi:secreted RxLR effector protein 161-like [Castanea sativa]|uniref:secreted RxLR effector protein 161-like n=1 Tax=Castanea sativa TaxID=21020 RepID=UPI003F64AD88